jgi:hypothetical protein
MNHNQIHERTRDADEATFLELKKEHDKIIGNDLEHTTLILDVDGLCKPKMPFAYFGGQGRFYPYLKRIVDEKVGKTKIWTDGVGGGIGAPFEARHDGYKAVINDYSYLTFCIGKAMLTNTDISLPGQKMTIKGYVTKNHKRFGLSESVATQIDSILASSNFFEKALLGDILMTKYTDQGYTWKADISLDFDVYDAMTKRAPAFIKVLNLHLPVGDAYNMKSEDFVKKNYSGGKFIYFDFAWAWRQGRMGTGVVPCNEYGIPGSIIASILSGKDIQPYAFWDGETTKPKLLGILDDAVKSYEYVIVNTQDPTNYPDPDTLIKWLTERYKINDYRWFDCLSRTKRNGYRECYFTISKK